MLQAAADYSYSLYKNNGNSTMEPIVAPTLCPDSPFPVTIGFPPGLGPGLVPIGATDRPTDKGGPPACNLDVGSAQLYVSVPLHRSSSDSH